MESLQDGGHDALLVDWMLCEPVDDFEEWVFLGTPESDGEVGCGEDPCTEAQPDEATLESRPVAPARSTKPRQIVISRELTQAIRRQKWRQRVANGLETDGSVFEGEAGCLSAARKNSKRCVRW